MNTNNEAYYTNTSGQQVMLTSMAGIDQEQFSALHINQYEEKLFKLTLAPLSLLDNKLTTPTLTTLEDHTIFQLVLKLSTTAKDN